ncbi:MAG: hypothetical protein RI897_4473 [Verrucomicrobiota bacterium]
MPGEGGDSLDELEGVEVHFLAHLVGAHRVERFDGDIGVIGTELDEGDTATGFEGGADGFDHFVGVGEFVVDVDHDGEVDGIGREFGVGDSAESRDDVGESELPGVLLEGRDHFGLDIDGVDFAGLADGAGVASGMVTGAGADIGDGLAGLDFEEGNEALGLFFAFAFGAFEPGDAGVAHDVGDFASAIEFADTVRVVVLGVGVELLGCLGSGGGLGLAQEEVAEQERECEEYGAEHGWR